MASLGSNSLLFELNEIDLTPTLVDDQINYSYCVKLTAIQVSIPRSIACYITTALVLIAINFYHKFHTFYCI